MEAPTFNYPSIKEHLYQLLNQYREHESEDDRLDPESSRIDSFITHYLGSGAIEIFMQDLDDSLGHPFSLYLHLFSQDIDELTRDILEIYHDRFY